MLGIYIYQSIHMTTFYPTLTELDDHPSRFYLFVLMVNAYIGEKLKPYDNVVRGILRSCIYCIQLTHIPTMIDRSKRTQDK